MQNGDIIRIILPVEVWFTMLEDINKFDNHLKAGLQDFLCINDYTVRYEKKPVFFEKTLNEKNRKSDLIYGKILINLISDIIRNKYPELEAKDYEVRLPYSMCGYYTGSNFTYINPYAVEQFKNICDFVEKSEI